MTETNNPVSPEEYSEEYFLANCDGYREYLEFGGTVLTRRLKLLWKFLDVQTGMRVLDVGCGRGEMIVYCKLMGVSAVGIDYSINALRLAKSAIEQNDTEDWDSPGISLSNAKYLPFLSNSFDRIIMSDIVEHLYPDELTTAFNETYRVLRPGGKLLIHTMPNLWYYRYGYPIYRSIRAATGQQLPSDPRDRFEFSHVHVNEQTPMALYKALSEVEFSYQRVWLHDYRDYAQYSLFMRTIMKLLTHFPLVKLVFCDDIFGLARK